MTKQVDASKVQDAMHYALAACPGGYHSRFGESVFVGRHAEVSPSKYLRRAFTKARDAGCTSVKRPRVLADAVALAEAIDADARAAGIDAASGEPLCTQCSKRARDSGCAGLCYQCHDAAKPKAEAPFKLTLGQIKALERLSNSPDGEESPYGHGRLSGIIASGWHRTIASLVERKLASLERYGDHYKARITTLGNTWLIGAGEAPEPQL